MADHKKGEQQQRQYFDTQSFRIHFRDLDKSKLTELSATQTQAFDKCVAALLHIVKQADAGLQPKVVLRVMLAGARMVYIGRPTPTDEEIELLTHYPFFVNAPKTHKRHLATCLPK